MNFRKLDTHPTALVGMAVTRRALANAEAAGLEEKHGAELARINPVISEAVRAGAEADFWGHQAALFASALAANREGTDWEMVEQSLNWLVAQAVEKQDTATERAEMFWDSYAAEIASLSPEVRKTLRAMAEAEFWDHAVVLIAQALAKRRGEFYDRDNRSEDDGGGRNG